MTNNLTGLHCVCNLLTDARMTSTRGKNKESRDMLQANRVTDVLSTFDVPCVLSKYARTAKWNQIQSTF